MGIIIVVFALVLRFASSETANVSYFLLSLYALLGRAQAIHALALTWLFIMFNPGLAPVATESLGRYIVIAAAAGSVLLRSGVITRTISINRIVFGTLFLGAFIIAHSMLFSPIKDVSVLKALSWTLSASTSLAAWSGLSSDERDTLARQVFGGLIVLMVCSLPLLVMQVGYLRNGTGFQGLLNQPQAFGFTIGLLGAWLGGQILAGPRSAGQSIVLFGTCVLLILLSESRTAGFGLLLGIVLAAIAGPTLAGRSIAAFVPGFRSRRIYVVVGLSLIVALTTGSQFSDRIVHFVSKRSGSSNLVSVYEASRGSLIYPMLANIRAQPWRGIGFGIASDQSDMVVVRNAVLGVPMGTSVEKGVLPIAVLEELGVFGFFGVLTWLWMLAGRAANRGGIASLSVFFSILFMNMGEFVLFSLGGMGLLCVILIGWAATARGKTSEYR